MSGVDADRVPDAELEAQLRRAQDAGQREYGALPLSFAEFARHVLEAVPVAHRVAALRGAAQADLFLAAACESRVAGAWEVLVERFVPRLKAVALRQGLAPAEADELARSIPGEVFLPPPDGRRQTRIGTYSGSGSLFSWLTVILIRRRADRRLASRGHSLQPGTPGEGSPPAPDPVEQVIGREAADRLREALAAAWRRLSAKERLALLYRYRDDLPRPEMARLLRITPTRVNHLLQEAFVKVREVFRTRPLEPPTGSGDLDLWRLLRLAAGDHLTSCAAPPDLLHKESH
jgi:DNA-directed RNA polymerase specialized sigma24 family protein